MSDLKSMFEESPGLQAKYGSLENFLAAYSGGDAEQPGILARTGNTLARGVIGAGEMAARGAHGLSQAVEDYTGLDTSIDSAKTLADDIRGFTDKTFPRDRGLPSFLGEGVESATTSLTPVLAGAGAGLAVGGPAGAVVGGLAGLLGGVPVFGGAEYSQAKDDAAAAGLDPEAARSLATKRAVSEAGTELVSDLAGAGAGKMFLKVAAPALKEGVSAALKPTAKTVAKQFGITFGTEGGSELLNSYIQAESNRNAGLSDKSGWEAVKEQAPSIAVASAIFGVLGPGLGIARNAKLKQVLSSPEADPAIRQQAVNEVSGLLAGADPTAAAIWKQTATDAVASGQAIPLDQDVTMGFDLPAPGQQPPAQAAQVQEATAGLDAIISELRGTPAAPVEPAPFQEVGAGDPAWGTRRLDLSGRAIPGLPTDTDYTNPATDQALAALRLDEQLAALDQPQGRGLPVGRYAGTARGMRVGRAVEPEGAAPFAPMADVQDQVTAGGEARVSTVTAPRAAGLPIQPPAFQDVQDRVTVEPRIPGVTDLGEMPLSERIALAAAGGDRLQALADAGKAAPGDAGVPLPLPSFLERVKNAVENKSNEELWDLLRLQDNKRSRALFFELTGLDPKMAKTQRGMREAIDSWAPRKTYEVPKDTSNVFGNKGGKPWKSQKEADRVVEAYTKDGRPMESVPMAADGSAWGVRDVAPAQGEKQTESVQFSPIDNLILDKSGKPFKDKTINLAVANSIKRGRNVEAVQIGPNQWGMRPVEDAAPQTGSKAERAAIAQELAAAGPDYDAMRDRAEALIDGGQDVDVVYDVLAGMEEKGQEAPAVAEENPAPAKEPWQMTKAEAGVGEAPSIPEPPRPLAKVYGRNWESRPDAAELKKGHNAASATRSKALKAYKAYVERSNAHLESIKQALADGKDVPAGVLAEYPFLEQRKEQAAQEQPAPAKAPPPKPTEADTATEKLGLTLGEKIGGSRKDTAESTGERVRIPGKDGEGKNWWQKRFTAVRTTEVNTRTGESDTFWGINDAKGKLNLRSRAFRFDTKEEAEQAIPLAAVSLKHRVMKRGDTWEIYRKVTDRKGVTIKDGFATEDDAKRYMAVNAADILDIKTGYGEEILAKPEKVMRGGVPRRDGPAKGQDFLDTFGFRGVEFGEWNDQLERQEVLNHAYDGLLDMAEILGLPPKALSLNGELALAFGARGRGLSSAKAHYERDYGVINLTKMTGAGSLAHEWFHAMDHYFARQDGKASSEKVQNERGDSVFNARTPLYDFQSHGPSLRSSKMREELRDAYKALMHTMTHKVEQFKEDTEKAERFVGRARGYLEKQIKDIRTGLTRELQWGKKRAPATAAQLAKFDSLADQLLSGDNLTLEMRNNDADGKRRSRFGSYRDSNDVLDGMAAIYKEVRGRSGFTSERTGPFNTVAAYVRDYAIRAKMLADARNETEKTKQIPTEFARDSYVMDRGRTTDYWSTPHEMAARAFSSYLEDKTKGEGRRSDFLVYGANNNMLEYRLFNVRPFPEGQEREAINAAFDKFFQEVKTKETDKGVVMYSRNPYAPANPLPRARVSKVIDAIMAEVANAPGVTSYDDHAEASRYLKRDIPADARAFFLNGEVHVIGNMFESERDVASMMVHELFRHYGFRAMLGNQYRETMKAAWGNRAVREKARELFLEGGYSDIKVFDKDGKIKAGAKMGDFVHAADEAIAHLADDGWKSGVMDRIISQVRAWLRKALPNLRWSDAEIRNLISASAQEVLYGRRRGMVEQMRGAMAAPAFQRVYHGSPHRDIEKNGGFSTEYIGTGEGAQAYGYGLYFAGKKDVAEYYKGLARPKNANITPVKGGFRLTVEQRYAPGVFREFGTFQTAEDANAFLDDPANFGQLYEAEIPEDHELLDWDKPLSEQPQGVREKLEKAGVIKPNGELTFMYREEPQSGREIYERLTSPLAEKLTGGQGQQAASEYLASIGIPGLRYLDGTSRGQGGGHHNYVIFQDDKVSIERVHYQRAAQVVANPDLVKGVTGEMRNDLAGWQKALSLPHWIAKQFPKFAALYNRQMARVDERLTRVHDAVEAARSFYDLPKTSLDEARKIIWKIDGLKIEGLGPWTKEDGKLENGRTSLALNEDHYAALEQHLKKEYGASGTVAKAVADVRRALDQGWIELHNKFAAKKEAADTEIANLRSQMGKIHNYFPHKRYGDYYIKATDQDGNTVYREHFDMLFASTEEKQKLGAKRLKKRAEEMVARLAEKYPGYTWEYGDTAKLPEAVYEFPIPVDALQQIVNAGVDKLPGDTRKDVKGLLEQAFADVLKERGFGANFIQRQNVPGHETQDVRRVFHDHLTGLYGFLTKMDAARDFVAAMRDIDAKREPRLYEYAQRFMQDMLRNSDKVDRAVAAMKAVGFVKYLGLRIPTAALNLTQNIISGIPVLSMHVERAGGRYFWTTAKDLMTFARYALSGKMDKAKGLTQDEAAFLKEAYASGHTQAAFVEDMQLRVADSLGAKTLQRIMDVAGWPMAVTERFNRATLALAAYRAARDGKIINKDTLKQFGLEAGKPASPETAGAFARMVTDDAHFVYGKGNMPQPLRGSAMGRIASTSYQFRRFSHNMLGLYAEMMRSDRGKQAMLRHIGGLVALGGLASVPLYRSLMAAVMAASGEDGEELLRKMGLGDVAIYGVPALAGVTFSGSMGLDLPVVSEMSDKKSNPIWDLLGVPGSLVRETQTSMAALRAGRPDRALWSSPLMPNVIRNVANAIRLEEEGARTLSGKPIPKPGETAAMRLTEGQALAKKIGFQPIELDKAWRVAQSLEAQKEFVQEAKSAFASRYVNALNDGDTEKAREIMREVQEWNRRAISEKKRHMIIDLRAAVRARKQPVGPSKRFRGRAQEMMENRR